MPVCRVNKRGVSFTGRPPMAGHAKSIQTLKRLRRIARTAHVRVVFVSCSCRVRGTISCSILPAVGGTLVDMMKRWFVTSKRLRRMRVDGETITRQPCALLRPWARLARCIPSCTVSSPPSPARVSEWRRLMSLSLPSRPPPLRTSSPRYSWRSTCGNHAIFDLQRDTKLRDKAGLTRFNKRQHTEMARGLWSHWLGTIIENTHDARTIVRCSTTVRNCSTTAWHENARCDGIMKAWHETHLLNRHGKFSNLPPS